MFLTARAPTDASDSYHILAVYNKSLRFLILACPLGMAFIKLSISSAAMHTHAGRRVFSWSLISIAYLANVNEPGNLLFSDAGRNADKS